MHLSDSNERPPGARLAIRLIVLSMTLLGLFVAVGGPLTQARSAPLTGTDRASSAPRAIAHGVADLPASEIAWRIAAHSADPVENASPETFVDGFTVGTDGELVIADLDTGNRDLIGADEATFNANAATLLVASTSADATDYARISLVPTSDRESVVSGTLVAASEPFDAPSQPAGTGGFTLTLYGGTLGNGETTVFSAGDLTAMLLVTSGSVSVSGADGPVSAGDAIAMTADTDLTGSEPGSRYVIAAIGPAAPGLLSASPSSDGSTAPSGSPSSSAAPSGPGLTQPEGNVVARTYICPDQPYWTIDVADCAPASDLDWDISFTDDAQSQTYTLDQATIDGNAAIWSIPDEVDFFAFTPTAPTGYGHVEPLTAAGERSPQVTPDGNGMAAIDFYFFPYGGDLGNAGGLTANIELAEGTPPSNDTDGQAVLRDADGNEIPMQYYRFMADGPGGYASLPFGTYLFDLSSLLFGDREVLSVGGATETDTPGILAVEISSSDFVTVNITIGAASSTEPSNAAMGNDLTVGTTRPCIDPAGVPDCTESAGSPQLIDAAGNVVTPTPTPSGRGTYWLDLPNGTYTLDLTGLADGLVVDHVDGDAEPTDDPLVWTITVDGSQDYGIGAYFTSA